MGNSVWETFWNQITKKRDVYKLDTKSFFHYVALEYMGYKPNSKPTELEKRRIRNLQNGTEEYRRLEDLYNKRMNAYAEEKEFASLASR